MDKKLIEGFKKHIKSPVDYNTVKVAEDTFLVASLLQSNPQMPKPPSYSISLWKPGVKLVEVSITQPQYMELIELLAPEFEKYKQDIINNL